MAAAVDGAFTYLQIYPGPAQYRCGYQTGVYDAHH